MAARNRWGLCTGLVMASALLLGCAQQDVGTLAGDRTAGRDNGTPGSALARDFLIRELARVSAGLDPTGTGAEAFTQAITAGTNVVSVIRGTDLANQYVIVGAHYDHLGSSCQFKTPGDQICNGATDNAAGVAAVLSIARSIAAQSRRPRRSIVFALWDREEDGLIGSREYVQNPLVPLEQTVAYVNFDIQGANLLPSLRNTSFAVAAESGGPQFRQIVQSAVAAQTLGTVQLSSIFGQGRSDYQSFLDGGVPSVFFTDATGPCYHTSDDEREIVDFGKLNRQIAIALRVTRVLATTSNPPAFVAGTPLATYDDAVVVFRAVERALVDLDRFSPADQDTIRRIHADLRRIAFEGPAAFGSDDVNTLLGHAATLVLRILPQGECDGFLPPAGRANAGR